uniref:Uncharacterized protein n=1 Tax=Ditylenchus dipsaci TaxID=166011 RepID=A0A915DPP2_9BILA
MLQVSFKYNLVPKFQSCEDIRNELKSIKGLCAKHELLCRSFASWRSSIEQNDSQLDILNRTAASLRNRHKMLAEALALRPKEPALLIRLQREISAVESQVNIFIRELTDISDDRSKVDLKHALEFIHLRSNLQRSMTNIELAHIDIDVMQRSHHKLWKKFLVSDEEEQEETVNYMTTTTMAQCPAGQVNTQQTCVGGACAAGQTCNTATNACCAPGSRCARRTLARRQMAQQRRQAMIARRQAMLSKQTEPATDAPGRRRFGRGRFGRRFG